MLIWLLVSQMMYIIPKIILFKTILFNDSGLFDTFDDDTIDDTVVIALENILQHELTESTSESLVESEIQPGIPVLIIKNA
jgi:hypothetical protein